MRIEIDDDCVTYLSDLAKRLHESHRWKSHRVEGDTVYFTGSDGREYRLDTTGFAQVFEDGEWQDADEENVMWGEEFDAWSNYVWGADDGGATVMVHD